MRVRLLALPIVVGLAVAPAAAQDFTFDRQRPFAVKDRDVSVREITYAGPSGEATEATLVAPVAPGRHPAVLFVHWYGPEHTTSNRTQYVPDALALARHGIVSLLVDTPWSEPRWFPTREPASDVTFSTDQVKAPKESKFYDCGHEMNREAMDDRVAWLIRLLGAP